MPSPAERYAAAAARSRRERSEVGRFTAGLDFPLDDFQLRACAAVEEGKGVLVAAPTGAGKTIVGEFAVHLALWRPAARRSTPRRSRPCRTRSTTTSCAGTAPTGWDC